MKHGEQLTGRLMDCAHDSGAPACQRLQRSNQLLGTVRVKASRWFITKQNGRFVQQFGCKGQSFFLATRQHFTGIVLTDSCVRTVCEPSATQ